MIQLRRRLIIVEELLVSVVAIYLITAFHFFLTWLDLLLPESSSSLQADLSILIEVIIGSLLWPVVIIIADIHSPKHDALEEVSTNQFLLPSATMNYPNNKDGKQQVDGSFWTLK